MTARKFFYAGVAGLALAVAAMPALAQYRNQSTPQERAQTEQLNRGAVTGQDSYVPPAAASEYNSARSDYDAAQRRYQQQLDEYNAKTRAYDEQRRRFNQNTDSYADQREDYAVEQDNFDARNDEYTGAYVPPPPPPRGVVRNALPAGLWALDRIGDPNYELYNMPVVDVDGFTVGHFRRVETRDNGERVVVVTLNSQRTVSLPWIETFYDPNKAVVVSNLTTDEIDRTPSGVFGP